MLFTLLVVSFWLASRTANTLPEDDAYYADYYYDYIDGEEGDLYYDYDALYYEDERGFVPTQPAHQQLQNTEPERTFNASPTFDQEQDESLYQDEVIEEDIYGDPFDSEPRYQPPPPVAKHGFRKGGGGGVKRMTPIAFTKYVDEMTSKFGCFLKKNSGPQKVLDPNYKPPPVNKTAMAGGAKDKRATQRELELARLKAKEEEEKRTKIKYPQGSDCETLVCGSCKLVVEEFGQALLRAIDDPRYEYMYDVASDSFCEKVIVNKYSPIVVQMCGILVDEDKGYREALVKPFEDDPAVEAIASAASLYTKKKSICLAAGACTPAQFDFTTEPEIRTQEQWLADCYVCQAAIKDIEERVCLTRGLTDDGAGRIVAGTCDRIYLAPEYDAYCRQLITRSAIEDIGWMAKVHYDAVNKKDMGAVKFPDKVCEDMLNEAKGGKYCEKWIDPAELKRKNLEDSIEPVFY